MTENRLLSFYRTLKELSIFTKNLIVYKANFIKKDRVHIRSIQPILERTIGNNLGHVPLFTQDESIVSQFLEYLSNCGEITKLGGGYYTILPERYVRLPVSQSLLKVGDLKRNEEVDFNLGLSEVVKNRKNLNVMPLSDYRFDFKLEEWMKVFEHSDKTVILFNEEYYRPTKHGFKKVKSSANLKEGELYYIISRPFENKKEYFIAKKVNNTWNGEMINENLLKSRLALLTSRGYCPGYQIKIIGALVLQITLSDSLPSVERQQAYLFSLPHQFKNNKTYYIRKKHLPDFIYILQSLKFKERNENYEIFN